MRGTGGDRRLQYLIGLDLGTSAVKGVLMSSEGAVVSREKAETEYFRADDGRIELDTEAFYSLIADVIRTLAGAVPERGSVVGVSMASASGNTLLLDGSGKPMLPAFSWMDTRVTDEVERVFGRLKEDEVHQLTGWPLIPMFPLAHLAWLQCHKPLSLSQASRICMTTDYVNYRLTGRWGIDPSTATTFYLQDQLRRQWHTPWLDTLGIPAHKLPPILSSGTVLGGVTEAAAAETGLLPGTPVVLGAFDHPCAARGSGVLKEGQVLISCGTSWVGFYPVKDRRNAVRQKLLTDPFLHSEGLWGAMFSLPAVATGVDRWICRYITDAPDRYTEFDRLAAAAKPGVEGVFINPMEAPLLHDHSIAKANIARAIMEGTAYLLKARMDALRDMGIRADSVTMAGGPSDTFPWPQIVCDVLGMEVTIMNGSCAGAVGAAILAGIGTGVYGDERDAFNKAAFDKTARVPDKAAHKAYQASYCRFVDRAKADGQSI